MPSVWSSSFPSRISSTPKFFGRFRTLSKVLGNSVVSVLQVGQQIVPGLRAWNASLFRHPSKQTPKYYWIFDVTIFTDSLMYIVLIVNDHLLYRQECYTGKYTTCKIHTKLHPGTEWRIFHILTIEDIDDVISHSFMAVCPNSQWAMASDRFVYIIKRKLHSDLKIWILFSRVKNNILLTRCARS